MKRWAILFLLFPTLVARANPTSHPHTGTLVGTVLDAGGKPAAQATVTLQTSDGQHPRTTTANAQGHFSFSPLARGSYDLRAYQNGAWSEWKHNLTVLAGKRTDVTLRLAAPRRAADAH